MRRMTVLAMLCALALIPCAAYAADVQFHIITENGNVFILSPPDLPRPANIISETAFLTVENPPAGMFVLTTPNGTTQRVAPLQSGLDTDGFAGGTVRIILKTEWDAASDRTFRDQAFGRVSGNPLLHSSTMPLAANWNDTYEHVQLRNSSAFGLGSTGPDNSLSYAPATADGGYVATMNSRERIGFDFGSGTGDDHTYYIYRGCSDCDAKAVVGYGDPADPQEMLPNDLTIVDHHRGWSDVSTCSLREDDTWTSSGSNTVSATHSIPPAEYSNAGDHYIDSRYADLSILPQSHSSCSGTPYSENNDDNSKHDMCVTGTSASTGSTTYRFSCTRTVTVTDVVNGIGTNRPPTVNSCSTPITVAGGGCGAATTSSTSDGYSVSATCHHGTRPATPSDSRTVTGTGNLTQGRITTTEIDYSGSHTVSTTATVGSTCNMNTNVPYLDLHDAMSLKPGLNVYRPGGIPTSHHLLAIYDDAAPGVNGDTERIQVYRTDAPGTGPEPAGPYDFHLRGVPAGILYDSHQHYGWVSGRHYDSNELYDMGYTQLAALAGHGDGLHSGGAGPSSGSRLCHGDCFMGVEGINSVKPMIRTVAATSSHTVPAADGAVYDHFHNRWYDLNWSGAMDGTVTSATQYLVVPFAEDVSIRYIYMYNDRFDPAAQLPSYRDYPTATHWCHLNQAGSVARPYPSSHVLNVTDGESLRVPVLPGVRYVAFLGNGDCYWYDVTSLPSPLSGVAAGARHVPLVDGTILTGDLTVKGGGLAHIDVSADITAVWQSEMVGVTATGTGFQSWVAPPLDVTVTAVARVNGAAGACGSTGVHCSLPITLTAMSVTHGSYMHTSGHAHGEPYERAPHPLPPGIAGSGVYGLADGRCYGLAILEAGTGGITLRSIPRIPVDAGDTISLSFEAEYTEPAVVDANIDMARPAGHVCDMHETMESAVVDVSMMTATLR